MTSKVLLRERGSKSVRLWEQTRDWCRAHPNKLAMIATPEGDFTLTFRPIADTPKGRAPLFVDFKSEGGADDV